MSPRKKDLRKMKVRRRPCATCPFVNGHRSGLRVERINYYTDRLAQFKNQHLCHVEENKQICRGGRDLQLRLLVSFGVIAEASDEAFNAVNDKLWPK
jgi:hypothetical protein